MKTNLNKNSLINYLLCQSNLKLPISCNHYITGRDIKTFTDFVCIENTLSTFTSQVKCLCNRVKFR